MKRLATGIGVLAITAGFLVWWFHPNQVLKRRTKGLMQTLTLTEGAGAASRNLKTYPLSRVLANEVEIRGAGDTRANGRFDRPRIEAGFAWLARNARSTRFEVRQFESVDTHNGQGTVRAIVDANVTINQDSPLDGRHHVTLTWEHDGESWRLTATDWQPE